MAGDQAEERADINVLEMAVTGETDKNHSLSQCKCLLPCFVLQYVSSSVEH